MIEPETPLTLKDKIVLGVIFVILLVVMGWIALSPAPVLNSFIRFQG